MVNHTDGGDGTFGCVFNVGSKRTSEQRKNISDSLKGRQPSEQCKEASLVARSKGFKWGHRMSAADVEKMRGRKKGFVPSAEHRKKVSEAMKGRIFSEESRLKSSMAQKGKKKSEEHKRKLSEAAKKQWAEKRTWYYH